MPDWMTHVLVTYVILGTSSWYLEGLDGGLVALGMLGGLIPDLTKVWLVVPDYVVEGALGLPFTWAGLHTFTAGMLVAAGSSLLFPEEQRRGVFGVLLFGASLHLLLDSFITFPDPTLYPAFYPISTWEPPVTGIYLSIDRWPSLIAATLTLAYLLADRYLAPGTSAR